MMKRRK